MIISKKIFAGGYLYKDYSPNSVRNIGAIYLK